MADLLIAAQGGSGVPSVQMVCAATLQGLNGIFLAALIGIKSRLQTCLLASVLCLYPLFLDYYSFAVDHLSFVLGDTLCLLGALIWLKAKRTRMRITGSAALFAVAIGIYGPKVSLVSLLLLACLMLRLTEEKGTHNATHASSVRLEALLPLREVAIAAASLIAAIVIIVIISKLTVSSMDVSPRTHLNGAAEALQEIRSSYLNTYRYFRYQISGLPAWGFIVPAMAMGLGSLSLMVRIAKVKPSNLLIGVLILALVPVALHATWIINNEAWRHAGRIQSANGYFLVLLLGCMLRSGQLRATGMGLATIMLYFFCIHATQQTNFILMKSTYESNFINRIATRIEPLMEIRPGRPQGLVVIGSIPKLNIGSYVKYPERSAAITNTETFARYRQVEILNYFLGHDYLRIPKPSEVTQALNLAKMTEGVWPSPQSVKVLDDTIVVIMEKPTSTTSVTWTGSL